MMKPNKQVKTSNKTNKVDSKSMKDYTAGIVNKNIGKKTPVVKKTSPTFNEQSMSKSDKSKVSLACILLGLSIWGYYYFRAPNAIFSNTNSLIAYSCPVIGILGFLFIIFYWCSFGQDLIDYIKEATIELKKVVWPDRKTATRMTMLVIFFVFVLALFMWISDTFIQWILYDIILRR